MGDSSVARYATMIEAESMVMNRYNINSSPESGKSSFVEMMSFKLNDSSETKVFRSLNEKVGKETSIKNGFVQRITGTNDDGKEVVIVYWDTKENSDAYLQPFMNNPTSQQFMGMMDKSTITMTRSQMVSSLGGVQLSNKDKALALLNSFNTGDQTPIGYINPKKYIQHNLSVGDGLEGFGEVMKHAPEGGFKADVIRAFEDGDYVFTHTKYDFFGPKAAFDVFRFEDGLIVEHWDNMLEVQPNSPSGHSQFDGSTVLTDLDKSSENKAKVEEFINTILLQGEMDKITDFINPQKYIQHNPAVGDGLEGFGAAMKYFAENRLVMEYDILHKVLGQGNFVLTLSEGKFGKGDTNAFYDLFRLEDGLIVEHWDVISPIPTKSEWKNANGKF